MVSRSMEALQECPVLVKRRALRDLRGEVDAGLGVSTIFRSQHLPATPVTVLCTSRLSLSKSCPTRRGSEAGQSELAALNSRAEN